MDSLLVLAVPYKDNKSNSREMTLCPLMITSCGMYIVVEKFYKILQVLKFDITEI